jgi:hypothetical protein
MCCDCSSDVECEDEKTYCNGCDVECETEYCFSCEYKSMFDFCDECKSDKFLHYVDYEDAFQCACETLSKFKREWREFESRVREHFPEDNVQPDSDAYIEKRWLVLWENRRRRIDEFLEKLRKELDDAIKFQRKLILEKINKNRSEWELRLPLRSRSPASK